MDLINIQGELILGRMFQGESILTIVLCCLMLQQNSFIVSQTLAHNNCLPVAAHHIEVGQRGCKGLLGAEDSDDGHVDQVGRVGQPGKGFESLPA